MKLSRHPRTAATGACVVFLFAAPSAAQYVGSAACAKCHAAEFRAQSASAHAHALAAAPSGSPGEWAFGAGKKAVTYVGRTADGYVEKGRSYFSRTHAFGDTPGHANGADLPYPTLAAGASVARCFRCHSTGALRLGANSEILPSENGVTCEACHGPGARHAATGDPA
ncbi:MAG TPA: multiheme c-type cytochrome, partial [Bryobacteraceae bacterium]|nr:multiheme c-type cytochrome [Bryobacteraceae bacterium]